MNASVSEERHRFAVGDSSAPASSPAYPAPQSAIRVVACGDSTWRDLELALIADPTCVTAWVAVSDERILPVVHCALGGSLTCGGSLGELPALTQRRRFPPDQGVTGYACPMHDCLRAYRTCASKGPLAIKEWTGSPCHELGGGVSGPCQGFVAGRLPPHAVPLPILARQRGRATRVAEEDGAYRHRRWMTLREPPGRFGWCATSS